MVYTLWCPGPNRTNTGTNGSPNTNPHPKPLDTGVCWQISCRRRQAARRRLEQKLFWGTQLRITEYQNVLITFLVHYYAELVCVPQPSYSTKVVNIMATVLLTRRFLLNNSMLLCLFSGTWMESSGGWILFRYVHRIWGPHVEQQPGRDESRGEVKTPFFATRGERSRGIGGHRMVREAKGRNGAVWNGTVRYGMDRRGCYVCTGCMLFLRALDFHGALSRARFYRCFLPAGEHSAVAGTASEEAATAGLG